MKNGWHSKIQKCKNRHKLKKTPMPVDKEDKKNNPPSWRIENGM